MAMKKEIGNPQGNEKVSLKTSDLRDRLNKIYVQMRSGKCQPDSKHFDYLWDLKELALMHGNNTVDVPASWLDELEEGNSSHPGH